MKIAIIGGTGTLGRGLAVRFPPGTLVTIGSRDEEKAEATSRILRGVAKARVRGASNGDAARWSDVAILAIPAMFETSLLDEMRNSLAGKLVISPIAPMKKVGKLYFHALEEGSAAEIVASRLKQSRVAAALQTVPAVKLIERGSISFDVPVAAEERKIYEEAAEVIRMIDGLRPLYAGTLSTARSVESLTPFLINVGALNGMRSPSVKIVE